ncbi:MAG: hypothetical protein RMA76_26665 [Deltaproteobacteria bacterium]
MRTFELLAVYGAFGLTCALTLLFVARGRVADAALLVPFWPLYGPFLVLDAMKPTEGFERLLPDRLTMARLHERMTLARGRVERIDALLRQPDFSAVGTEARREELLARGDDRAAASTAARLENIRRLERLRERFTRELVELEELLAQLDVQSEVVRLAGATNEETRLLVEQIVSRVEGLDTILDIDDAEARV